MAAAGGALSGAISSGTVKGALWGAFSAMAFYGVGDFFGSDTWAQMSKGGMMGLSEASTNLAAQALAHGVVGGVMGTLQGNKFGSSFLAAGLTQFASSKLNLNASSPNIKMSNVLKSAMIGGTVSKITGGKFTSAAMSAAFANVMGQVSEQKAMDKRMADAAYGNRDEWVAMEWPSIPQPIVDGVAGFGDTASFGLSSYIRDQWDIGSVDDTSSDYIMGRYVGIAGSIGSAFAGGVAFNIGVRALGGANTLYHYTSAVGALEITEAGVINSGRGFYGSGVYTTAVRSPTWARISGAQSTQSTITIQGAASRATATPFPGTFRVPNNIPIK